MSFDKRSCLDRAKELLASSDERALRYACLELRYCMEAIVYEKLRTYERYVPSEVFAKWQAQKRLEALLQFEPDADSDLYLEIAEESLGTVVGGWIPVGEHHALKLGWLKKEYNRLGSYLHLPAPGSSPPSDSESDQIDSQELHERLGLIVNELEQAVESSVIGMSLAERVDFKCNACGRVVLANLVGAKRSRRVVCIFSDCGAEYAVIDEKDGQPTFHWMVTTVKCGKCEAGIPVEHRKLRAGLKFSCKQCGAKHILDQRWVYKAEDQPRNS